MSVLAVGSVAFDSIVTPSGRADNVLGGSATYFSLAASYFTEVRIVAVVGEDFSSDNDNVFKKRGIDIRGIQRAKGKTFRWGGHYLENLNEAKTDFTELNVFEQFKPRIPPEYKDSQFLFLGNIHPSLQTTVRSEMDGVRLLAGDNSLARAARKVLDMGPQALVVKHGEYGATIFFDEGTFGSGSHPFRAPALPIEEVKDPTGAGDSFAGGFMGYIAAQGELNREVLKRALFYGGVMGSFTVERFGTERLQSLTKDDIEARFQIFRELTHLE